MTIREYGSAYARASMGAEDDRVSMLSQTEYRHQSQYQPYRADDNTNASGRPTSTRLSSWSVSPVTLQQPLPTTPEQPSRRISPLPHMIPSLFSNTGADNAPYQEPVAWANSTQFRPTIQEAFKPGATQTALVVTETSVPPNTRQYYRHPRHILEPWKAGFWTRFPWRGFGALSLILMLTGASAGILLASHGMTMDDWRIGRDNAQPHVYISVFEMAMNLTMLFALADGVIIRFWRELLRGTTLSSMHDVYESQNLWSALKRVGRLRFNTVAIACILTVLSFVRGPLFQRSLTLSENSIVQSTGGRLNLQIAPYPIIHYFQSNSSDPRKQGGVTDSFSTLLNDLVAGIPLPYKQPLDGCGNNCTGTVKGFSFKTECNSSTQSFNLDTLPQECKTCKTDECTRNCKTRRQNEFNPTFFSINYKQENESLILTSVHKSTSSCKGDVQIQTCRLTQVMSDYPIIITNGTIDRLANQPGTNVKDEKLPLDNLLMKKYWPLAFETLFPPLAVNVTPDDEFLRLQYNKCVQPRTKRDAIGSFFNYSPTCSKSATLEAGLLANDPSILFATENESSSNQTSLCNLAWRDPMQDILSKMQSLAFRVTVSMATSNPSIYAPTYTGAALADLRKPWTQALPITGSQMASVYQTNPILVAVGVFISVLGVIAIIPLYNGFWELGRTVSLNPLEIARAFGAPLLDGVDGNATPEMITVERGGMNIRYGALERFGDGKRLRIEETSKATVRMPWRGEIFG